MKGWRTTVILAALTVFVLAFSIPGSLRAAFERGNFYVFSHEFFEQIPMRLAGPGRFRFFFQPLFAMILGVRSGIADAKAGRPPYLYGILFDSESRGELAASAFRDVVNLLLMGILLDSLFQWVLIGASYPGAALVVGPVLIVTPYALSRALANRVVRLRARHTASPGR
jgi:hypothetical protein